jgi:hypothetical protein
VTSACLSPFQRNRQAPLLIARRYEYHVGPAAVATFGLRGRVVPDGQVVARAVSSVCSAKDRREARGSATGEGGEVYRLGVAKGPDNSKMLYTLCV